MCFSPEADLVGGLAIGAIGADAVRHAGRRRDVALASLPLVLGTHQLIETFVWWADAGRVSPSVGRGAMWAYLLIAFCVLPVQVPMGIFGIEASLARRRTLGVFVGLGVIVAAVLLGSMLAGPVAADARRYHIEYSVRVPAGGVVAAVYIAATCIPLLVSGVRGVTLFGAVNLPVALLLAWLIPHGFASIWCAWAAVSAGAITAHLRWARKHRRPPGVRHPAEGQRWRRRAGEPDRRGAARLP